MLNKTWNRLIIGAFVIGGITVVSFNYFIDPYEVFKHQYLRSGYAVNERFRKIDHLLNDKTSHDAYLMGSSVMGLYDPAHASQLSGLNYYNLSFLAGTPNDAFAALRSLKEAGHPIKEIVYGIDFFTFYEHPKENVPALRAHPLVSGESCSSFYSTYLFSSSVWQGTTRIAHHFQDQPSIYFDVDGSGMFHLYDYDRRINADHPRFIHETFTANQWGNVNVDWVDSRFDEFAEFSRWLDANGIRARFFIHPFYRDTLNTISVNSYAEFEARVRKIRPDVVDFSDMSTITSNPIWYYDKRHYRPVVANRIMDILFSETKNVRELETLDAKKQ